MDEELFFKKKTSNSINSFSSLAQALRVSEEFLNECLAIPEHQRYKKPRKKQFKKDGSLREVLNPCGQIRKIQTHIKNNLLESNKIIIWPPYIYGVAKRNKTDKSAKDFVASATEHCKCKTLLKLDIVDFFQNIGKDEIFRIFNILYKYPVKISAALTNLCTFNGHLPQGAITSSHLSSLVLFDSEPDLVRRLSYKELKYTRYIDDISVSSKIHNYKMDLVKKIIVEVLEDKNLSINENKTEISSNLITSSKVHGLLIHKDKPILPSEYKRNLRAAIHQIKMARALPNGRTNSGYRERYRSVLGRTYHMKRLGHPKSNVYLRLLKAKRIIPKVSKYYIDKIDSDICFLEKNVAKNKTDWYLHLLKIAEYKISINGGSYEKRKNNLLERIRKLRIIP